MGYSDINSGHITNISLKEYEKKKMEREIYFQT